MQLGLRYSVQQPSARPAFSVCNAHFRLQPYGLITGELCSQEGRPSDISVPGDSDGSGQLAVDVAGPKATPRLRTDETA